MKRDMELMRKILFAIEEQYEPGDGTMWGPQVDGYDMEIIAEHCDLLRQKGLIKEYKPMVGGDKIQAFRIGNITDYGYDYLELIRNNDVWKRTNIEIEEKKLPNTLESIAKIAAEVAGIFTGNVIKEMND